MGKELGPGKTIVTILRDKSDKYSTKMFNKKFLEEKGLPFPRYSNMSHDLFVNLYELSTYS